MKPERTIQSLEQRLQLNHEGCRAGATVLGNHYMVPGQLFEAEKLAQSTKYKTDGQNHPYAKHSDTMQ